PCHRFPQGRRKGPWPSGHRRPAGSPEPPRRHRRHENRAEGPLRRTWRAGMTSLPREKRARLILNTDAKNEADDQFTIVHALLTPTFDFHGIIAAHFGDHRSKTSMEDSRVEIDHLLKLMDLEGRIPVANGAPK